MRRPKSLLLTAAMFLVLIFTAASSLTAYAVTTTLTVTHPKGVGGTVTATGIDCGSDCSEDYTEGDTISLTPAPAAGRVFAYWYPATVCSGSEKDLLYTWPCHAVIGSSATTVGVVWAYETYTVSVVKEGSGSGTVTGAGSYPYKTKVTLTATPASGSKFAGWQTSGDQCYTSSKSGKTANTSASCLFKTDSISQSSFKVVAKFDKVETTAPAPAPEPVTPKPLPITDFSLNGTKDFTQKPVIKEDKITLTGTTTPLAKVVLYIHSDPKTVETTADAQGAWTVQVGNLEDGDHTVEAEVIDPTTQETSERKQIAAFTVENLASKDLAQQAGASTAGSWLMYTIVGGIVALGAVSAGIWWWLRHKKGAPNPAKPGAPIFLNEEPPKPETDTDKPSDKPTQ